MDVCTTFNQLLDIREPLEDVRLDGLDLEKETQTALVVAEPLLQHYSELEQRSRLGLI